MKVKRVLGIIGLMFKFKCPDVPYFVPLGPGNRSIHTWFMFFPIDLLFVDSAGVVLDRARLNPWGSYNPQNPDVVGAIEWLDLSGFSVGDKIAF